MKNKITILLLLSFTLITHTIVLNGQDSIEIELDNNSSDALLLRLKNYNGKYFSPEFFAKKSNYTKLEVEKYLTILQNRNLIEIGDTFKITQFGLNRIEALLKQGNWVVDAVVSDSSAGVIHNENSVNFSGNKVTNKSIFKVNTDKNANVIDNEISDSSKVILNANNTLAKKVNNIVDSQDSDNTSAEPKEIKLSWYKNIWMDISIKAIGGTIGSVIGGLILLWIVKRFTKKDKSGKKDVINNETMILEVLSTKQFKHGRTISGIITDTGLSGDIILEELTIMKQNGIVKSKKIRKKSIWSLTIKGKRITGYNIE